MLDANIGRRRWRREDLAPDDRLIALPESCWPELDEAAKRVRAEQPSITSLQADRFELAGCREIMATVRRRLTEGVGFAVLDRVPVERYGVAQKPSPGCWRSCSARSLPRSGMARGSTTCAIPAKRWRMACAAR
jgi:hypothetical protein